MPSPRSATAFTLIELMVVVAIIAILTGLAAVAYTGVQERGRDAERKNDLNQIKLALSTYYNAQVPPAYYSSPTQLTITGSDTLSTTLAPAYTKTVPVDPTNVSPYLYHYKSLNSAADFQLSATLENKNDKKGWISGAWATDGYIVQDE